MEKNKREFIINDLMVSDFITCENREIVLEELEETGKSELNVQLSSSDNLCIANVDKKKTEIQFLQKEKTKSMYKRVDHIIFAKQCNGKWKLYLIEMKGSVGERKWDEIKGKFRASYLFPRATSQATACRHLATAARVKYPAALQHCKFYTLLLAAGFLIGSGDCGDVSG